MGPRANKSQQHKKAFLAAYAGTGNISAAAKAAGIDRTAHYEWIKSDEAYREAFDVADAESVDLLEREARRRAAEGVDEPVIHQGQMMGAWVTANGETVAPNTPGATLIPLTIKKYSDTLLIFLLKGARPERYRDNARVEHTGRGGGPIETKTTHAIDYDQLRKDLEAFAGRGTADRRISANGNGKPVHPDNAN